MTFICWNADKRQQQQNNIRLAFPRRRQRRCHPELMTQIMCILVILWKGHGGRQWDILWTSLITYQWNSVVFVGFFSRSNNLYEQNYINISIWNDQISRVANDTNITGCIYITSDNRYQQLCKIETLPIYPEMPRKLRPLVLFFDDLCIFATIRPLPGNFN